MTENFVLVRQSDGWMVADRDKSVYTFTRSVVAARQFVSRQAALDECRSGETVVAVLDIIERHVA